MVPSLSVSGEVTDPQDEGTTGITNLTSTRDYSPSDNSITTQNTGIIKGL